MKLDMTIFILIDALSTFSPSAHLWNLAWGRGGGGEMGLCLVSRQCLKVNGYTFNTSRGHESENPVGIC